MQKKYFVHHTSYFVHLLLLFLLLLSSCTDTDRDDLEGSPVMVDLAFSVSRATQGDTRLTENVIQTSSASYRGIEKIHMIPFDVQQKVTKDDPSKLSVDGQTDYTYSQGNTNIYYKQQCSLMRGVASCLCYARAVPTYGTAIPTIADKASNGSLLVKNLNGQTPAEYTFSPEPIYQPAEENNLPVPSAEATALATYLTNIANTEGWKDSPNSMLKVLHTNFCPAQNTVMAGSSSNVRSYVNELYATLTDYTPTLETDEALKNAILANIQAEGVVMTDGKVTSLGPTREGYPANVGLPDGAAALLWSETENAFVPQLTKTSIADINDVRTFAFPAELYYYTNSRLRSSNKDDRKIYYTEASKTWQQMLDQYEVDNAVVNGNTKAIAIKEPMRYAVAHLQLALKSTSHTLADANGKEMEVRATSFPLTGVIVDQQYPVGFDFTPQSATDEYLMYDSHVQAANGTSLCLSGTVDVSAPVHTFVLQTPENKDVMLVLEFQNNSGVDFRGAGGVIYKGTKFYLLGKLELSSLAANDEWSDDLKKRVFTQGYTTTVGVSIPSLAKAYNVMPNIRSPYLEVGVEMTPQWVQAETTNVILE